MKKFYTHTIALILLFSIVGGTNVSAQTTGTYSTSAINNLLIQIRAAIDALSAINTANQTSGTSGTVASTGASCTITINASILNVRSTPSVSGALVRQLSKGQTFTAIGSVTGDAVEGSNKWWRTSDGYFVWAGGTTGGSNCSGGSSTGGNTTGSTGGTTGTAGTNLSSLPTPGTGSGNCTILPGTLSDGMRVVAVSGTLNSSVVVTDDKVTAGTSIYMFSPIVEQYDGWAKVSVNGVDYPIAGPGTTPVAGQPYSTSGQNHTAFNRFDVVVPNLPVADGSSMTIKLFKADTSQSPYTVQKTFKYHSSLTLPNSDPVILPHAKLGQNYSAPLTPKCGGNVVWEPRILTGILPRAFDVVSGNLVYNPAQNFVKPEVGDIGTFFMIGKSGNSDVVQKFHVNVVSASTNTSGGTVSGSTGNTSGSATVTAVYPNFLTAAQLIFGWDITVTGSGFNPANTRVDLYQGTGLMGSLSNLSVTGSSIKGKMPSNLAPGAYLVQVTVDNTLATGDQTKRSITVSPF